MSKIDDFPFVTDSQPISRPVLKFSGAELIAKFEKGVKALGSDIFGVLITFEDDSQAYLLPTDKMLTREMEFVETFH